MNKLVYFILAITSIVLYAESEYTRIPQMGSETPFFKALSTHGEIEMSKDFSGKWVILLSFPGCKTPVCTSELKLLLKDYMFFKSHNTEIVGLNFHKIDENKAWIDQVKKDMNIRYSFPIVSDDSMEIAKKYGIYHSAMSKSKAMRNIYIIDPKGKVRAILMYPMFNGRSIKEIKRLMLALQASDKEGGVTLADWEEDGKVYKCTKCFNNN